MQTHYYDLPIRVLFYRDGRDHVAHALELDLVAYGEDEGAAIAELQEMMKTQLAFASHVNDTDLVYHRAPKEFFERWEEAHAAALSGLVSGDRTAKLQTKAVIVTLTAEDGPKPGTHFERTKGSELAETA